MPVQVLRLAGGVAQMAGAVQMTKPKLFAALAAIGLLGGCAAKPLRPGAERIFVSTSPPPAECRFLGEVAGAQGGWWTSEWTADENLVEGSRNEIKNQALKLGANRIHTQQAVMTGDIAVGGGHVSMLLGNAYLCPDATIQAR